jgi:hypothetical protein
MTHQEAAAVVAAVERGETRGLWWEGPDAYCSLYFRYDEGRGLFTGVTTELPFDVLSPFREGAQTWDADALLDYLQTFPPDAVRDQ